MEVITAVEADRYVLQPPCGDCKATHNHVFTPWTPLLFRCSSYSSPAPQGLVKPNPVLGNLVPLIHNFHRFLGWATDLLAATPASIIEVRGPLGLGNGVATADPGVVDHLLRASFPNYANGARFADPLGDLLGRGLFLADGRLWTLQRQLASHSFSSRSLRRVLRAHLLPFLAGWSVFHLRTTPGSERRLREAIGVIDTAAREVRRRD